MPSDAPSEVKFQIGHVLFIDIVAYSKLLINEQSEQIQKLKAIVRGTEQVRLAEAEGKLLRLPTGDGGALVFRTSPEAPVLCALEISKELKKHPELQVRMGIHSGPVNEVTDLDEQANIAGAGINIAQRVMDCGDAGHILLSKHVADDLEHYPRWRTYLHELGECAVKHGVRIGVVNIYSDAVGNSQIPKKFRTLRKRRAGVRWGMAAAALLLVAATVAAFLLVSRRPAPSISNVAEKSLAVLPLVNTGGDPNNEYFSDGLSEELIAVLAKVPALKIISRSSSFLLKGTSEDSRAIGKKLGVMNLLEGSVRKQGDRVRIVAEMISAADGRELWTETYDRELKDVFAVQSEIATAVTAQLKIKLLGPPPQSDAAPLNENLAAYTALQQGNFYASRGNEEGDRRAIEFYDEAIRLDPTYALAYAQLAGVWQNLAERFLGGDELVAAYGKARSTAQMALSLPPNLSEAHQVMGEILMITDHNYDEAAIQFRQAEALAPGAGDPKASLAYLLFAQGRLPEAEEMARKAQALNPLALGLNLVRILIARERYDEAEALLRRAIQMRPKVSTLHMQITNIYLLRGKTAAALEEARLEPAGYWQDYALALAQQAQGDRASADTALQKFIEKNAVQGAFQIATMYALRKEPGQMFTWLERAYEGNDAGLSQLLTGPFIRNYRGDPRFAALCQKLKLPVPQPAQVRQ
ncbi:MAG TPA: adenylate/guanylate cyclase domain-containing protein [Candidatus Polarisedimenticolia bacterium]|nr:adenylate/guanylate cyclase domain-containing protein [Candidatus Polarisedimenticolia bacterium]